MAIIFSQEEIELVSNPEDCPQMLNLMNGLDRALAVAKKMFRKDEGGKTETEMPEQEDLELNSLTLAEISQGIFGQKVNLCIKDFILKLLSFISGEQQTVKEFIGREPWSSGYGKRLTFQRSWV